MAKGRKKETSTTLFLLPLLFSDDIKYTQIICKEFKNAYIADLENKQYDDKILLVYSDYPKGVPLTNRIADYKTDKNTIFVYELPEEFIDDYGFFLTGDITKFSDKAKKRILDFWQEGKNSLIYTALYALNSKALYQVNLNREILGL